MPVDVKYIDNGVGVIYIGKGKLTGEDVIKADQNQLLDIEKLKNKKWVLNDFSGVDEIKITNTELRIIANLCKKMFSIAGVNP